MDGCTQYNLLTECTEPQSDFMISNRANISNSIKIASAKSVLFWHRDHEY